MARRLSWYIILQVSSLVCASFWQHISVCLDLWSNRRNSVVKDKFWFRKHMAVPEELQPGEDGDENECEWRPVFVCTVCWQRSVIELLFSPLSLSSALIGKHHSEPSVLLIGSLTLTSFGVVSDKRTSYDSHITIHALIFCLAAVCLGVFLFMDASTFVRVWMCMYACTHKERDWPTTGPRQSFAKIK